MRSCWCSESLDVKRMPEPRYQNPERSLPMLLMAVVMGQQLTRTVSVQQSQHPDSGGFGSHFAERNTPERLPRNSPETSSVLRPSSATPHAAATLRGIGSP